MHARAFPKESAERRMRTGWKFVRLRNGHSSVIARRFHADVSARTCPSDTKLQQLWLPVNVLSHSVPIQKTPYAMAESNVVFSPPEHSEGTLYLLPPVVRDGGLGKPFLLVAMRELMATKQLSSRAARLLLA